MKIAEGKDLETPCAKKVNCNHRATHPFWHNPGRLHLLSAGKSHGKAHPLRRPAIQYTDTPAGAQAEGRGGSGQCGCCLAADTHRPLPLSASLQQNCGPTRAGYHSGCPDCLAVYLFMSVASAARRPLGRLPSWRHTSEFDNSVRAQPAILRQPGKCRPHADQHTPFLAQSGTRSVRSRHNREPHVTAGTVGSCSCGVLQIFTLRSRLNPAAAGEPTDSTPNR
jgi:hypothetical protein